MKRQLISIGLLIVMLLLLAPAAPAIAAPPQQSQPPLPSNCKTFPVDSPAHQWYLICLPVEWNGDLVIYAHGYVPPIPGDDGLLLAWQQLITPDGKTFIPGLLNQLGFVFAATTYTKTGLAVKEGLQDTLALAVAAPGFMPGNLPPKHIFLIGASEGGLITTQAMEMSSSPFSAGVAACGPIGDFRAHINYLGDFRVLFDYFFPGVLKGSPIAIPDDLFSNWLIPTTFNPELDVLAALQANPSAASQLISTSKAAIDPNDPTSIGTTAIKVLNYNVVATMDAHQEIGTQPYSNIKTLYFGSTNDLLLNKNVERIPLGTSEADLTSKLSVYQTSGKLRLPLVTIHTVRDPEVPFWQEALYFTKVLKYKSTRLYTNIPIMAYGHCNFTAPQLLAAFAVAYLKGIQRDMPTNGLTHALPLPGQTQQFNKLLKKYRGANP